MYTVRRGLRMRGRAYTAAFKYNILFKSCARVQRVNRERRPRVRACVCVLQTSAAYLRERVCVLCSRGCGGRRRVAAQTARGFSRLFGKCSTCVFSSCHICVYAGPHWGGGEHRCAHQSICQRVHKMPCATPSFCLSARARLSDLPTSCRTRARVRARRCGISCALIFAYTVTVRAHTSRCCPLFRPQNYMR